MTEGRIEPDGEGKCGVQKQVERRAGRPESRTSHWPRWPGESGEGAHGPEADGRSAEG